MKKYVVMVLLFLPIASMAAPSVRMLGAQAGPAVAAKPATAGVQAVGGAKVTPTKANTGRAASTARVGSLRARSATGTGAIAGSGSRFPIIKPATAFSTVSSPKPTNTTVINNTDVADVSGLEKRVTILETTVNDHHTPDIEDLKDDPRFDSVRIGRGADWGNRTDGRAWFWIEEAD